MPKKSDTVGQDTEIVDVEPLGVPSGGSPDAWTETAYVSIAPIGKGELNFETLTETIDIDIGEKGVEWIPNLIGGRLTKFTPMADSTVTLELYPLRAGTAGWPSAGSASTAGGVFDLYEAEDSAEPISVLITSINRVKVRLTILWTNQTSGITSAASAITTSKEALRISLADGYITSIKPSFTDGILKFSVTLKFPPTDKSGNGCIKVESCDTSASLSALNAYTATTKF